MRRRALRGIGGALLLLSTSCQQLTAIWVEPGSTAFRLVFGVAERRGGSRQVFVTSLRVERCFSSAVGPETYWDTSRADSRAVTDPRRVVYGIPPAGWASLRGPHPLTPGCYRATIEGTGMVEFQVQPDAGIVEWPEPGARPAA